MRRFQLDVECHVVTMEGWQPAAGPGFGWPLFERSWVNPSPNASNPWMARCYPGTVMLEGTTLSEGRGTTRPLEVFGAPDLEVTKLLQLMKKIEPRWLHGCVLRPCWFEPTFHKHAGKLCAGVQIHVEGPHYRAQAFRPWRLMALAFKAIRKLHPDYPLWRDFPYEYETRLAIDVINGGSLLRQWVDDKAATPADLDAAASAFLAGDLLFLHAVVEAVHRVADMREAVPLGARLRVEVVIEVVTAGAFARDRVAKRAAEVEGRIRLFELPVQGEERTLLDELRRFRDALGGLQVKQADLVVLAPDPPPALATSPPARGRGFLVNRGDDARRDQRHSRAGQSEDAILRHDQISARGRGTRTWQRCRSSDGNAWYHGDAGHGR